MLSIEKQLQRLKREIDLSRENDELQARTNDTNIAFLDECSQKHVRIPCWSSSDGVPVTGAGER